MSRPSVSHFRLYINYTSDLQLLSSPALLSCEQPAVYVFDTAELAWKTSYTVNTVYTTPDHEEIIALAGGRGTGSSVSGSGYAIGTGADDIDNSWRYRDIFSRGGKGNTGAMALGILGAVLAILLSAGLISCLLEYRKTKRQEEDRRITSYLISHRSSHLSQLLGSPHEDPKLAPYGDDDVEQTTAGYDAQFMYVGWDIYEHSP